MTPPQGTPPAFDVDSGPGDITVLATSAPEIAAPSTAYYTTTVTTTGTGTFDEIGTYRLVSAPSRSQHSALELRTVRCGRLPAWRRELADHRGSNRRFGIRHLEHRDRRGDGQGGRPPVRAASPALTPTAPASRAVSAAGAPERDFQQATTELMDRSYK